MNQYRLFGLTVASEIPLPLDPQAFTGEPRVWIAWGAAKDLCAEPGKVLARFTLGDRTAYVLSQCGSGYQLEFPGRAVLRFSQDLRQVKVVPDASTPQAWISHLLVGTVPTTVLTLSGEWVLHASAVALSGSAVAFAGRMAAGKTTLALVLAQLGARWITDDLLRLHFGESGPQCVPGPGWARMRQDLLQVLPLPPEWSQKPGPEGRTLVQLPGVSGTPQLRLLLFPEATPKVSSPVLEELPVDQAFRRVFEGVKLQALLAPPFVQQRMDFAARVVRLVPVYRLLVPWGLPALLRTAQNLWQQLMPLLRP